jgi:hypothetical protein
MWADNPVTAPESADIGEVDVDVRPIEVDRTRTRLKI